jgi:hypothetical protein
MSFRIMRRFCLGVDDATGDLVVFSLAATGDALGRTVGKTVRLGCVETVGGLVG